MIKVRAIIRAAWKLSNKAEFVTSWEAMWSSETEAPAASSQACRMTDLPSKCQLFYKPLSLSRYKEISKCEMIPLSWLMGKIESFGFSPVNSKFK